MVAESFSGALAISIAARAPAHLKAVVLVASFVRPPRSVPRWIVSIVARLLFRFSPPRWAVRWALLGSDAPVDEVDRLRTILAGVPPATLASRLRRISATDVMEAFQRCSIPMLYVGGTRDRLVPRRDLTDLLTRQPSMEHVVIDGPHLLLQRRAEECAAVIVRFLSDLSAPNGR